MRSRLGKKKYSYGLSLIETLVGSAIFLIIALATYRAFTVLMTAVVAAQAKTAAASVANETVEIIRNLPYTSVGTVGGTPAGSISPNQNITKNDYTFTVVIAINNIDDSFDGVSPADTAPADYKLIDLTITCSNCNSFSTMKFNTLVAPRALES